MRITGDITPDEALSIYLQDHYAGAQGGTDLARRAADNQRDTPYGPVLAKVAADIEQDESTLEQVMDHLGVERSSVKGLGASIGEKLGRLKLNGQLTGESPLTPVVEIEGLLSAVKSKQHVWEALRSSTAVSVPGVDFEHMLARGDDQIERLETIWQQATSAAFPS